MLIKSHAALRYAKNVVSIKFRGFTPLQHNVLEPDQKARFLIGHVPVRTIA
jgi:hypothetical protein